MNGKKAKKLRKLANKLATVDPAYIETNKVSFVDRENKSTGISQSTVRHAPQTAAQILKHLKLRHVYAFK